MSGVCRVACSSSSTTTHMENGGETGNEVAKQATFAIVDGHTTNTAHQGATYIVIFSVFIVLNAFNKTSSYKQKIKLITLKVNIIIKCIFKDIINDKLILNGISRPSAFIGAYTIMCACANAGTIILRVAKREEPFQCGLAYTL